MTREQKVHVEKADSGLSLIELIVYVLLASVLLGAMALILVNSWRTQEDVTSVSGATNRGQVMGSALERAMRNALDFDVDNTGTVLRVRTSLTGPHACQGFLLTDDEARIAMSSGALPANTNDWADWESDVVQNGTSPFFVENGDTVVYTFDIETDSAPVRFSGEAAARSVATGTSSPCW
ncbi:MAG TPA: hypothetical protein VIP82_15110 [Microbacterium sp.]|uniref:PilW family protein n=1 Tax=Actinomycetes TaxID=1760 RepID=UPI002F928DDC